MGGPPLWYCPVECRNRGPQPNVIGRPGGRPALAHAGEVGVRGPVEVGHHREVAALVVDLREQRRRRRADRCVSSESSRRSRDRAGVGEHGRRACRRRSSISRAAFLALSTSGWSNGLIPMSRPATEVAYSHSSICAPSGARRRRPAGSRAGPPCGRRADVTSTASGVLGSKLGASRDGTTTGRTPLPFLPVDSAMSCSAQSPTPGMPESCRRSPACRPGRLPRRAARRAAARGCRRRRLEPAGSPRPRRAAHRCRPRPARWAPARTP